MYSPLRIHDPGGRIIYAPDRSRYLVEQVRNKNTLHVGCTDYPITEARLAEGSLLHLHLRGAASALLGIDISEAGLRLLQHHGSTDVTLMDAEHLELSSRFECILAGDVVEHLSNPGLFLAGAVRHLDPDGELIIGVPSAFSLNCVQVWLKRRELVHEDHTFYFSPKTLAHLCSRYGLLPTRLVFTVQPASPTESRLFLLLRSTLIRLCYRVAPSMIMHFAHQDSIDKSRSFVWD